MSESIVVVTIDGRGVATLTLNKPEIHNAFDDQLIARLSDELRELDADKDVRLIVLAARGKSIERPAPADIAPNCRRVSSPARRRCSIDSL